MDNFINEQALGQRLKSENGFALNRARSRDTMLASRPKVNVETVLRLLDGAVAEWGYQPHLALKFRLGSKYDPARLELTLPGLGRERISDFLAELNEPFGTRSGATRLAQATLLAAQTALVHAHWGGSLMATFLTPDLKLDAKNSQTPGQLGRSNGELNLRFYYLLEKSAFQGFRATVMGRAHDILGQPERLLPLESASRLVEGFFDYRTRPFTAIRSYARWPIEGFDSGLLLDLWPGPYSMLDAQTAVLNQRERGRFLFLSWRPNYGHPTLLHHSLDGPLEFGKQGCRGTFWVASSDQPAQVHFFSDAMLSDPVPVKGPAGLVGVIFWPGLSFDVWGSQLVRNDELEKALTWAQERVELTAQALSSHIELVVERLREGNLVKSKAYVEETVERVRQLWGQPVG